VSSEPKGNAQQDVKQVTEVEEVPSPFPDLLITEAASTTYTMRISGSSKDSEEKKFHKSSHLTETRKSRTQRQTDLEHNNLKMMTQ
jgi:hypothetical protein